MLRSSRFGIADVTKIPKHRRFKDAAFREADYDVGGVNGFLVGAV